MANGARGKRGTRPPRDNLSRDERASYGGESGFAPMLLHVPCPDCRDNELSPPSVYDPDSPVGRKMGRRRQYDCPECGGYGVVPALGKHRLDPYMIPKRG